MKRWAWAVLGAPWMGAAGAQPLAGPYISLGAGIGLQQTLTRAAAPDAGIDRARGWQFDPGPAGQIALGWGLGNGLRLEVEAPYVSSKVSDVTGTERKLRAGGSEAKYGGLANVLYDFNLGLKVTPFVGIGLGDLAISHRNFNAGTAGFVFPHDGGGQTASAFAYQGIVGLSYPMDFLPGLAMTAEYHYVGIANPAGIYHTSVYNGLSPAPVASFPAHYTGDATHELTLGLRFAMAAPQTLPPVGGIIPAAPPPAPAATRTYLVFFDWDRADLSPRARQIVAEAATASVRVMTTRIDVNGYTDLSGTASYNVGLSARRAETVRAELVRDGVAAGEVVVAGLGESTPSVATALGVREARNRRVVIVLH